MSTPLDMNHVRDVCKIGKGADCCRYLTCSAQGFECEKHSELKEVLDERARSGKMTARSDNCHGVL